MSEKGGEGCLDNAAASVGAYGRNRRPAWLWPMPKETRNS